MNARMLSLCLLALAAGSCARGEGGWSLEKGSSVSVSGKVTKGKDISAAAAFGAAHAVIGSDETRSVQSITVDPAAGRIQMRADTTLIAGDGTEVDIEGIAASPSTRAYYVTGSHSLSRQKMKFEQDRSWVFQVPVGPDFEPIASEIKKASLRPLLQADAELKPHLDQPSNLNGLDIEGLAERDGTLYFGCRAPVLEGHTFVLEIPAKTLFNGGGSLKKHPLPLGPGRGVRELTAIRGGFLVLSGSSGSDDAERETSDYLFHFWPGPGSEPVLIGSLGKPLGKAEGVLVLGDEGKALDLVVFFDGVKEGGPVRCTIKRP